MEKTIIDYEFKEQQEKAGKPKPWQADKNGYTIFSYQSVFPTLGRTDYPCKWVMEKH